MITLLLLGYVLPMLILAIWAKRDRHYKLFLWSLVPVVNVIGVVAGIVIISMDVYVKSLEPKVKNWVEGNTPAPKKTRKKRTKKTESRVVANASPDLL